MSLVVPGVAESSDAYVLSPTGLRPLKHRRVTGGIGVALEDLDWASMILFTSDPLAYAKLARTVAGNRQRTAQLQLATTIEGLRQIKPLLAAQSRAGREAGEAATDLGLIEANLNQGQRLLAAGDAQAASTYARRAAHSLARLRRQIWERSAQPGRTLKAPAELFLAMQFAPQPDASSFLGSQGKNHLPSGNMENLKQLMDAGWRNYRRELSGVTSGVELSPVAPNTGQYSLRLQATRGGQLAAAQLESPPVWIRSPAVATQPGQPYVVQGWVRLNAPLAGSHDGMMIFDTHQGRELAIRIRNTEGWQPFRIHGVATSERPIAVNIELTGVGEAFVDDVEILLPTGQSAPAASTAPDRSPSTAQRLRNLIRLPR